MYYATRLGLLQRGVWLFEKASERRYAEGWSGRQIVAVRQEGGITKYLIGDQPKMDSSGEDGVVR